MRFKLFALLFLILSCLFFSFTYAASENTGFVDSSIWYSKDNFVEGEKIKIYTFVFNPNANTLKGSVSFYDEATLLGKKDFSISGTEGKAISIDWNATVGSHRIFARIENAKLETTPGKYEEIDLNNKETEKDTKVVAKKLPDVSSIKNKINEAIDSSTEPLLTVGNNIVEKTPESITNPIAKVINSIESTRVSVSNTIEAEKTKVESEIDKLTKVKPAISDKSNEDQDAKEIEDLEKIKNNQNEQGVSNMEKPFKYVKLFLLTILSFILLNPALLYLIVLVLVFLFLRFIYKRLF